MRRTTAHLVAWGLAALGLAVAAAGAEKPFTAGKLPGCDDLPRRMASHYKPVTVEVKPAAPQYKLPLDVSKLANADFAAKIYQYSDEADALLKRNGFAVVAGRGQEDVASFYKNLKVSGLPIFITSDSLLHLYHIQFDETLKDVEEREFAADALTLSKAVQAEALNLFAALDGELKESARLLVGFATVPAVLLSQTDLGAEAGEALKEISSWPARPDWQKRQAFMQKYAELLEALQKQESTQRPGPPRMFGFDVKATRAALEKYVKAHPARPAGQEQLIPGCVAAQVKAELGLIAAHSGFAPSPLFGYKEDYSQYVPRGHYTRSKLLKQYFKALMWYGRMTFLIRGRTGDIDGLISLAEARKQTRAACMLAGMMESKLPDGRTLAQAWDRLYAVTAFYVGFADDLTPYQYRAVLRDALGQTFTAAALADEKKLYGVRKGLAEMPKPLIYSGLGDLVGPPAAIADEQTLAKALAETQGLRLMGQRYIPDSFMMGRLVYPTVGLFAGKGSPFTLVQSQGGPIRGFPRGLDVMAVLGSKRAREWLKTLGDDAYARYDKTLADLRGQFDAVDQADWNGNMYWSWLHTLQSLLTECPEGYPSFMQTDPWQDKQLSAALASWSQLRHDTILYAKQSYTMTAGGLPPQPKMVEGYVEPVPEFYGRLLALTRMTLSGLDDFKVLDDKARRRLQSLEQIVERLLKISGQELANQKLTADDYAFIRAFGDQLKAVVAGVNEQGLETTIVADVHTDANTRTCLEEGTGYLHTLVVVYPMPDGGLVAGAGPILSHYEFKHPISDRLTDEAWKSTLRGGSAPELPEWARTFTVQPAKAHARGRVGS